MGDPGGLLCACCVMTWAIVYFWYEGPKGEGELEEGRGDVGVKPTPGPTVCTCWKGLEEFGYRK